ncbi:ankyrin repeat-containing domain protein [Chytridium lagenaria]|nr:ankyrin repeat-containing domain protein [Chytridium lagenaria]
MPEFPDHVFSIPGPSSIGWASFSTIKTVVLLDQRLGKASFTDLPLEVILRILCVPQGKPRFGQVRPINRLRMLNYLSATCRRLRSSLWESPHAVARVILTQNGMDVMEAINFFLKLMKSNSRARPCKGHPLGSSFELDTFHGIIGKRILSSDEIHSILTTALFKKDLKFIQALLDMGADVNHEETGELVIGYALAGVRSVDDPGLDIARMFLSRGLNLNHPGTIRRLWSAAEHNIFVEAMFLLEHSGIDVDVADTPAGGDRTALIKACRYNHVEMARLFIDHGANVNYGPGLPLSYAAGNGNRELIDLLVSRGADVKAIPPSHRRGPIAELCCSSKSGATPELLEHLIQIGCPIYENEGRMALDHCACHGKASLMKVLLRSGAEPTPWGLMAACELGKIEIVEILLDEGVRIAGDSVKTASDMLTKLGRVDLATKLAQGSLNDVVDS